MMADQNTADVLFGTVDTETEPTESSSPAPRPAGRQPRADASALIARLYGTVDVAPLSPGGAAGQPAATRSTAGPEEVLYAGIDVARPPGEIAPDAPENRSGATQETPAREVNADSIPQLVDGEAATTLEPDLAQKVEAARAALDDVGLGDVDLPITDALVADAAVDLAQIVDQHDLDPEVGERIIAVHQRMLAAEEHAYQQSHLGLLGKLRADAEFGGVAFERTLADARSVVDRFADDNVKYILASCPVTAIAMLRTFARIARALR